jgi:carbonic anhydrase
MKKLIKGIVEFRQKASPAYRDLFARLALGQRPDTLFIACSDSRVAPNVFASTDPGDLFVVRNVGNMIPPCGLAGTSDSDESEVAAVEFALMHLRVSDIIVCGHSECGAMQAISSGRQEVRAPHLRSWLRHGLPSLQKLNAIPQSEWGLARHNKLSQLNVLQQLEHLKSYPIVRERIDSGALRLSGWWFDIERAEVRAFEPEIGRFVAIDEEEAERLLERLK